MIITKDQYKISNWSGGKTKELFIYPQGTSYQNRDFQVRISSATVEIEESNFTYLPNYNRVLMVLNGVLEINHKDKYQKRLEKYSCHYFDGAWETRAKGKVTDFNLMTSKELGGFLNYELLEKENSKLIYSSSKNLIQAIYLIEGKIIIKSDNDSMEAGDLLVLKDKHEVCELIAKEESKIINIIVSL